MHELHFSDVDIADDFWSPRLILNSTTALFHQWNELEKSGCINNFRVAAKTASGIHKGWFFADSDAYKWLDAAARSHAVRPNQELALLMEDFIELITTAQEDDGYLYTYNQIFFPESRWQNLNIEHELYCHGHLIEAGISHYESIGSEVMLIASIKAADLLVNTFLGSGPECTPGHQEIEIALMHLADLTNNTAYLDLAEQFIEERGKSNPISFAWRLFKENNLVNLRTKQARDARATYAASHPEQSDLFALPSHNETIKPRWANLRFTLSGLNGKYFQQHKPVTSQTIPVGHAVRYAYLQTAAAMLSRRRGDYFLEDILKTAWSHMIEKRMYVTGGTGSLPISEGFGNDYELDPYYAYAETCAALGTMFWNWEMTNLTGDAAYADLFERQLYNASLVGMGQNGTCYLYNNPLASSDGYQRQPWFEVPCCPSNLSRTWASIGKYIYSYDVENVWVHQYIGNHTVIPMHEPISIEMSSKLPWEGESSICIHGDHTSTFTLHLRMPSWTNHVRIYLNEEEMPSARHAVPLHAPTASGYDPRGSQYLRIRREWTPGDRLTIQFDMPMIVHRPHPLVRSVRGKAAVSRGPLVYCLEGHDNPNIDLHQVSIDPIGLEPIFEPNLLGGVVVLQGKSTSNQPVRFIPYAWWANREPAPMSVYFNLKS